MSSRTAVEPSGSCSGGGAYAFDAISEERTPVIVYWALRRLVELIGLAFRSSAAKEVEIIVLRHQLHVLRRQVGRPRLHDADRALLAALSARLVQPSSSLLLVRRDTVLGWHRALVRNAGPTGGDRRDARRLPQSCVE
jgi:hypothetical protein